MGSVITNIIKRNFHNRSSSFTIVIRHIPDATIQ